MPARRRSLLVFGLLAVCAAGVFLAISIDPDVYAPGAWHLSRTIAHHAGHHKFHAVERALAGNGHEDDLSLQLVLRKLYSIVAFAVVGLFAAPLIRRDHRLRGTAVIVAGFSTVIEIVQKGTVAPGEPLRWELFDVACGALGGWLGALLWNGFSALRAGPDRAAPPDRAPVRSERSASD